MSEEAFPRRERLRVPVEAPWLLWDRAECVIGALSVALRESRSGALVRVAPLDLVERRGRVLRFRSRAAPIGDRCVDFAGMGRDFRYELRFADEATAASVAARIEVIAARLERFAARAVRPGAGETGTSAARSWEAVRRLRCCVRRDEHGP